jgi:hypothetical protein
MTAIGLNKSIIDAQQSCTMDMQILQQKFPLKNVNNQWTINGRLVVVGNDDLKRGVISLYHDFPTAGHPGQRKTLASISRDYWWPDIRTNVSDFVKGCAICQSTKPRTTQPKPPIYPITTKSDALPFETIAMDFITKLPISATHDTILTITDQGATKAAIFLPCKETINAPGVVRLYAQNVFPHYGLPKKIISDRDPRFTANFAKELCRMLNIEQNISTAYHPQTDGQSERSNQWVEQ